MIFNIIKLLRPRQWLKNGLLLAALVFSGKLGEMTSAGTALIAAAAFCPLSSSVYVLNDILDRRADAAHPRKKNRPVASGRVGVGAALAVSVALLGIAAAAAFFVGLPFMFACAVYYVVMVLYSLVLKHIAILDVMTVASGFVIRAVAGGLAIAVDVSPWLIICTTLLSLFIVLNKRKGEMESAPCVEGASRRVLKRYTGPMLGSMISAVDGATLMAYCMYAMSFDNVLMLLTVPFVIFGLFRYQYLSHLTAPSDGINPVEAPETALLTDLPLLIDVALWGISCAVIIYII